MIRPFAGMGGPSTGKGPKRTWHPSRTVSSPEAGSIIGVSEVGDKGEENVGVLPTLLPKRRNATATVKCKVTISRAKADGPREDVWPPAKEPGM
jgi:hypothetical protein